MVFILPESMTRIIQEKIFNYEYAGIRAVLNVIDVLELMYHM